MNRRTKRSAALRLLAAVFAPCAVAIVVSAAQGPTGTGPVRTVVVLDPSHGGADTGAKLADQGLEKDVTLAFAAKLRPLLAGAGFTVVMTRDAELPSPLTADQRAEVANRQHAVACLVLHATAAGSGVHVYASPLQPLVAQDPDPDVKPAFQPTPWNEAQAGAVAQSLKLVEYIRGALAGAGLPVLRGRASVPPLDNLTCPAIAVEIAPMGAPGEGRLAVSDAGYQQRIAGAVLAAMKQWRDDPMSHPAASVPAQKAATQPARPAPPAGAPQ